MWALDFQFDETADGRALKLLTSSTSSPARRWRCWSSAGSTPTDASTCSTGSSPSAGAAPEFVRCDNGPEMTAHALRDWCRFSRTGAAFIEPGIPWQNPFVESFHSRVRDELLGGRGVLLPGRGEGDDRGLAAGLQPLPATPRARDDDPRGFRKSGWETAHQAAPASAELRSPYGLAPFDAGGTLTLQSPTNHQLSQQVDR